MRKVLWTAAVLSLCAAPVAAQQVEKSPFVSAPAAEVVEPRASETSAPSLRVTPEQLDESVRAAADERGERQQLGTNFWYTVGAVALGIIIASLLLN